ncbi:E3 ubiquitin-protein ligase hrd1 [Coemansia thaxteri]|uniref:RING-type E3 ubiquitin transferase n=1 Tax=Coemansia thaxteri TaxID=2663907 RepID=A0A9W8BFR3_9FUNG|nr:E3 ubiquitin-protein ligase hrd1 [Coemansia thaxteri]
MSANSRRAIPRLAVYGATTTVLTVGVVASAFTVQEHFYTGCVLLSQSGAAMMVLANMGLLLTILLGKLLVRVFFGQLRAIEVEHLYEQGWLAVTETCLALAILRDEFDAATLTLFVFLLFCKLFHWMLADRVAYMEQQTRLTALLLARITALSLILLSVDCLMLSYAVGNTRRYGATMMIVFGFEYALLLARFLATCAKFVLNSIDIARGGEWEDKQTLVFYVELVYDFARLVVYLLFFAAVMAYYGPPIHILRDLYITARSFYTRCRDWARYRKAMQNMHLRYPTVSQDELDAMSDTTCIICRDDMTGPSQEQADAWNRERRTGIAQNLVGDTPKRLPCSHVFHFNCLRSWLEHQQSCPTCRHSVLDDTAPAEDILEAAPAPNAPPQQQEVASLANAPTADSTHRQQGSLPLGPALGVGSTSRTTLDSTVDLATENLAATHSTSAAQPLPHCSVPPNESEATFLPLSSIQGLGNGAGSTVMSGAASFIPIFPQVSPSSPFFSYSLQSFPAPDLSMLSDDQIKALDSGSRAAVEERIRILSMLQAQLSHMLTVLTQVHSLPPGVTSQRADFVHAGPSSVGAAQFAPEASASGEASTAQSQRAKEKEPDILPG